MSIRWHAGEGASYSRSAFTCGTYSRHGCERRLGQGGSVVGTATPGITGSNRLEGRADEWDTA
jgi:hypothetical protein